MDVADHVIEPPVRAFGDPFRRNGASTSAAELWAAPAAWEMVPANPDGYAATASTWYCDLLMVTRCRGDASSLFRRERHLGDPFDRYVHMVLVHEGSVTGVQGGRQAVAGPGGIVTLLPSAPYGAHNSDGADATLLHLPVDYLEYRGIDTDRLAASGWSGGPLVAAIRGLVNGALDASETRGAQQAPHIERAVLELAVALLGAYRHGFRMDDDAAAANRARVLDLVEGNFADPAFGIALVAAKLGASRRYVYRLFEGRKVSVASIVKSRRVDEAAMLLRTGSAELSLARIARMSGFDAPASLSRAFKELTGTTPSQYRAGRAQLDAGPVTDPALTGR